MHSKFFRVSISIVFVFLLGSCASKIKQKSYHGGIILKNTVWSGDIQLDNDILVPMGVTLTLEPGCNITVSGKANSRLKPMFISDKTEILVLGSLNIIGKKGKKVYISTTSKTGWAGIIMLGNNSSVSIKHAVLTGADVGIYVLAGKAAINNTTFNNNDTGILVNDGDVSVNGSYLVNNRRGMVVFGGKSVVRKSIIKNNKTGIIGRKNINFAESNTIDFQ